MRGRLELTVGVDHNVSMSGVVSITCKTNLQARLNDEQPVHGAPEGAFKGAFMKVLPVEIPAAA